MVFRSIKNEFKDPRSEFAHLLQECGPQQVAGEADEESGEEGEGSTFGGEFGRWDYEGDYEGDHDNGDE